MLLHWVTGYTAHGYYHTLPSLFPITLIAVTLVYVTGWLVPLCYGYVGLFTRLHFTLLRYHPPLRWLRTRCVCCGCRFGCYLCCDCCYDFVTFALVTLRLVGWVVTHTFDLPLIYRCVLAGCHTVNIPTTRYGLRTVLRCVHVRWITVTFIYTPRLPTHTVAVYLCVGYAVYTLHLRVTVGCRTVGCYAVVTVATGWLRCGLRLRFTRSHAFTHVPAHFGYRTRLRVATFSRYVFVYTTFTRAHTLLTTFTVTLHTTFGYTRFGHYPRFTVGLYALRFGSHGPRVYFTHGCTLVGYITRLPVTHLRFTTPHVRYPTRTFPLHYRHLVRLHGSGSALVRLVGLRAVGLPRSLPPRWFPVLPRLQLRLGSPDVYHVCAGLVGFSSHCCDVVQVTAGWLLRFTPRYVWLHCTLWLHTRVILLLLFDYRLLHLFTVTHTLRLPVRIRFVWLHSI